MFAFLLILACVFIVCILIALIRLHVQFVYNNDGTKLNVKALFLKFTVYPLKKTTPTQINKEKAEHKGVELPEIKELLVLGKETFGRLRKKLRVDLLKADVVVASEDPFKTAMMFGSSGAGVGMVLATLENIFDIKKRDIKVNADFSEKNTHIVLYMDFSIRVGAAITIALFVLRKFVKLQKSADKAVKLEKNA